MTPPRIKVLIVDDSATVRQVMAEILSRHPAIEVVGQAMDPVFAMEHMKRIWPDVITLDVEMPRMDGITFLRQIMKEHPTPVIICSSLTGKGTETCLQAIEAGAFAIFTKPSLRVKDYLKTSGQELLDAVQAASRARMNRMVHLDGAAVARKLAADAVLAAPGEAMTVTTDRFVAVGTSTGGTQALEQVLTQLPRTAPGMVVVQHMPELFTAAFARRLDSLCEVEVKEAASGDRILQGRVLIAPGGKHLTVRRSGAQYLAEVMPGPPVNRHCPSVDVLFRSVAKAAGRNATGVIMTGMGDDGARGLLEMRQAGAYTVAQDEASCIVFGMPKEAMRLGAAMEVAPLGQIPALILGRRRKGGGS